MENNIAKQLILDNAETISNVVMEKERTNRPSLLKFTICPKGDIYVYYKFVSGNQDRPANAMAKITLDKVENIKKITRTFIAKNSTGDSYGRYGDKTAFDKMYSNFDGKGLDMLHPDNWEVI